jgi:hypothetical protein
MPGPLQRPFIRCLCVLLLSGLSLAQPARAVEVPVDVGVGPAATWWTGPLAQDQPAHWGLKLSVAAVLDRAFIARHQARVPARYRAMAARTNGARIGPSIFIPDALTISPKTGRTGMYGVTWRPIALSMPLARGATSLDLGVGALLTYTFIHSDAFAWQSMHFARPGLDLMLRWEVPIVADRLLVSIGWASQLYLPQNLGASVFEPVRLDQPMVWHVGQAFLQVHWRFPYEVAL